MGIDEREDVGEKPGPDEQIPVLVTSMYGYQTRQPYVTLVIGEVVTHLTPDQAREVGAMLVEVSMAADADAFLFEFVREELKADERYAGLLLRSFREWRQKRGDRGGQQ